MLKGFGAPELIIILVILLLLFGATRLPQLGGALGKGIKEFRKGVSGPTDEGKETEQASAQGKSRGKAKKA
ncbi:MAG: twin-arginine translocase TatA/TatE family subunit [Chloroflexota bacterium]